MGFPIRKFTDQSLFAAPHDLSQRTTSFIASYHLGIHQMLLGHLIALISNIHLVSMQPSGTTRNSSMHAISVMEMLSLVERPVFIKMTSLSRALPRGIGHCRRPRVIHPMPGLSLLHDVKTTARFHQADPILFSAHELEVVVEPDGIEPTTSCLQSTRSPS